MTAQRKLTTLRYCFIPILLAGVAHAQGQPERAREYAQKSLALAERHKLAELQREVEALLREIKP